MYLDNNLHISFVHDCISLHVNHKQMIYGGVDGTLILSSLLPIWHICIKTSIVCFLLHFYISINLLKGAWTEQRKEFNCIACAASKKCKLFICTKWIIAEMSLLLFHRRHCRSVLFSLFCSILFSSVGFISLNFLLNCCRSLSAFAIYRYGLLIDMQAPPELVSIFSEYANFYFVFNFFFQPFICFPLLFILHLPQLKNEKFL